MLDRIEQLDDKLKCFTVTMADTALKEAKRAEEELGRGERRGPLHGVPLGVKDLFDTKGVVTACGIPAFRNRVPDRDATVVRRLREAGAVVLGKLELTEAALALHHPDVSPPVNPWAAERTTGGSSSGSAVATAAGLCFGALGTDTAGSIRFPSLFNGLVGIKPTWGRVSRYGMFAQSETLDHIGPLTRSVEDAAALLTAVAGRDENDSTSLPAAVPNYLDGIDDGIKGVRLGFDEACCNEDVHPTVHKTIEDALVIFRKLGVEVHPIRVPLLKEVAQCWMPIAAAEAVVAHSDNCPQGDQGYSDQLKSFLAAGKSVSGTEYARANIVRNSFAGALTALLEQVDLIISPVMPVLAPTVEELTRLGINLDDVERLIRFTCPYNMSGNPTISLPLGLDDNGIPIGFQIVGRHLDEALLCRAGKAFQDAADWRGRRPPLAI
jgi:amidase